MIPLATDNDIVMIVMTMIMMIKILRNMLWKPSLILSSGRYDLMKETYIN